MTRRKKGTGTVFLDRGRWRWRIAGMKGSEDTRAEAERVLAFWREELDAAPPTLTVWRYLERWMDARELAGRVRWTDRERGALRAYVEPWDPFHELALSKLKRKDCVRWLRDLEQRNGRSGKPLAKNTIRSAKRLLHRAFEDAVDQGEMSANPMAGVRIQGGAAKRSHDWLRPEEVESVMALELTAKQRAIVSVATYAGLSPLELWSLRWEHVDLSAGMLHVRGQVKRKARVRDVPLIRGTSAALVPASWIYANPGATPDDIVDIFGVSYAAASTRLSKVKGGRR